MKNFKTWCSWILHWIFSLKKGSWSLKKILFVLHHYRFSSHPFVGWKIYFHNSDSLNDALLEPVLDCKFFVMDLVGIKTIEQETTFFLTFFCYKTSCCIRVWLLISFLIFVGGFPLTKGRKVIFFCMKNAESSFLSLWICNKMRKRSWNFLMLKNNFFFSSTMNKKCF